MKLKYIVPLILMLPILSACDQTDDVIEIFLGKTWKLTFIGDSKGDCMRDYFNDKAQWDAAMEQMKADGNFTIGFSGAEIDGTVIGEYTGRTTLQFSGRWEANGKNNSFKTTPVSSGASETKLGEIFIDALKNAYKYEGDTNGNLRIYFKEKNVNKYLLLYGK